MSLMQGGEIGLQLWTALSSPQIMGAQVPEVQARVLAMVSFQQMQVGNRAAGEAMLDRSLALHCFESVLSSKVRGTQAGSVMKL